MSRAIDGTYTLPSGYPVEEGDPIDPDVQNETVNDFASELTDSLSRSGKGGMLAALAMGNNKVTGLAAASASGDAISYGQSAASLAGLALTGSLSLSSTNDVNFTGTGDNRIQNTGTSDGADTGRIIIASTGGLLDTRGAFAIFAGNEAASNPGRITLAPGAGAVVYMAGDVTVTGALTAVGTISGPGSGITALNASQLTSGTVPAARLGGATAYDISAATVDTFAVGYRGIPTTGVTDWTDGKCWKMAAGDTLNTADMATGRLFLIYNNSASDITITEGAGVTLRESGTTNTGNRTLLKRGFASVYCLSGSEAVISGAVT